MKKRTQGQKVSDKGNYCDSLDTELKFKIVFTLSIFMSTTLVLYYGLYNAYGFYQVAALVQAVLVTNFFCFFWGAVISAQHLYFIRMKRRKVDHTRWVFVTEREERNMERAVESISSMIGLQGSNLDKVACATIYPAIAINLTAVLSHMMYEKNKQGYDHSDIAILFGAFGLWSLVTWQVENNKTKTDVFHILGTGLAIFGVFIAFFIQQPNLWLPGNFLFLFLTSATLYKYGIRWDGNVHRKSIALIVLQSIALLAVIVPEIIYLYCLK